METVKRTVKDWGALLGIQFYDYDGYIPFLDKLIDPTSIKIEQKRVDTAGNVVCDRAAFEKGLSGSHMQFSQKYTMAELSEYIPNYLLDMLQESIGFISNLLKSVWSSFEWDINDSIRNNLRAILSTPKEREEYGATVEDLLETINELDNILNNYWKINEEECEIGCNKITIGETNINFSNDKYKELSLQDAINSIINELRRKLSGRHRKTISKSITDLIETLDKMLNFSSLKYKNKRENIEDNIMLVDIPICGQNKSNVGLIEAIGYRKGDIKRQSLVIVEGKVIPTTEKEDNMLRETMGMPQNRFSSTQEELAAIDNSVSTEKRKGFMARIKAYVEKKLKKAKAKLGERFK